MTHNVNVRSVQYEDLSAEEKADNEAVREHMEATDKARQDKKEASDALKASAKAKLIAGEKLTEEEANILVGV
jgi:uncharacterized membrane protein